MRISRKRKSSPVPCARRIDLPAMLRTPFAFSAAFLLFATANGDGECPDINGRIISPGLHYVPGPDTCTLCICENGQPKWCKAVLCSPPQDCKSFRVGNTCCEFICLDDALSNHPDSVLDGHQDFGLRLIASAVTVILFLSILFFMVHRLRQRKLRGHQNRQMNEDQRSLTSIGYIGGSLGYLGGDCDDAPTHFSSLWKPSGNYFPRGEAPPPYDEAVAQARAEAIGISNMSGFHRSFPLNATTNMENLMRVDNNHASQARGRNLQNVNNASVTQFHNSSRISTPFYLNNLSNGPMNVGDTIADMRDRQVVVMGNNRARNFTTQHSIASSTGNNNFISTLKITSSLAAVTNRGIVPNIREQTDRNNFLYNTSSQTSAIESITNSGTSSTQPRALPCSSIEISRQHRTIPRILGTMEDQANENTRSFPHMKQQRSAIPKVNRENSAPRLTQEESSRHSSSSSSRFSADSNNPRLVSDNSNKDEPRNDGSNVRLSKDNVARFNNDNISRVPNEHAKTPNENPRPEPPEACDANKNPADLARRPSAGSLGRLLERHPLLPMPADTTPCGCSYESEQLSMMNDDQDDYHSECENCKSANGSRYYLDESEEGSEMCETMTLHRRPLPEHGSDDLNQLPTSLTLPVKTKRSRCPPGARDAWFSSMPGTSSSEDD